MSKNAIEQALATELPDCQTTVEDQNGLYNIIVIGERFSGLSRVKRQQLVYSAIRQLITSGAIHAVKIQAITPSEQA